jgi:tripartite-type tricarboxylate transporter receptor subunit TctC
MSRATSGRIISRRAAIISTLGLVMAPRVLRAQDAAAKYPDHPVRVIVSTSAAGGVDTFARIVVQKLSAELGQPFPVENRAGAGGSLGADAVFHSAADGYTLLASQPAPITTNALILKGLDYDPAQLEAVFILSHIPNVLLVRPDFPAKTVQEFIAYAKENPGKLNYASQGPGTTSHLTAALFESITHTKLVHVPYKGTGPALTDLIAGHVDLMFTELATSFELHKSGKARILAVATKQRVATVPDIPTLAEAGVTGCESDTWNALTAPPKTPAAIIAKLNAAANKAMQTPDLLDRYRQLSATPGGGTPAEAAAFIKEETVRWSEVIRLAGIKPE